VRTQVKKPAGSPPTKSAPAPSKAAPAPAKPKGSS
jgi:hypothetical protein